MGKKPKINPSPTDYSSDKYNIKLTKLNDTERVSFNFKCLCSKVDKFIYQDQESQYFHKVLERLHDLSTMTKKQLIIPQGNPKSLRCHPIDFCDTTESCFGLPNEEELYSDAWQFTITQGAYGRVHGYFIDNVFYVVWLDPKHELYSNE